jgi:hypothetical protein
MGVLAFAPLGVYFRETLHMDLRHLESNRLYRVTLNPFLSPTVAPVASDSTDFPAYRVVGPGIAFYQLPAGTYRPRFIGSTFSEGLGHPQGSNYPITGDTLSIQEGVITSLGFVEYKSEFRGLFHSPIQLDVLGTNIDTLIRGLTDTSLSHWSLRRATLRIDP